MVFSREILRDENYAKFLVAVMKKQNYTPHSRKSCLAALNKLNIFHGLTNIQDFSHDWPLVHKALSK